MNTEEELDLIFSAAADRGRLDINHLATLG